MTIAVTTPYAQSVILRAHGGGGEMMGNLVRDHILSRLSNPTLDALTDGAVLPTTGSSIVFTTDSYVVDPLEFPGGDIGRLAVCGTVNDLAVMGGHPIGLSLSLVVEEGFELDRLDRVVDSVANAAREASVKIVTGDTKVIERTSGTGLMINTAGVAELDSRVSVGVDRIEPDDAVLVNGTIGDHGLAVISVRNGLEFETTIESDVAPLNGMIAALIDAGIDIHFMRDATRGGIAGVLADISEHTGMSVEIDDEKIPRLPAVHMAAEILGLDLLSVANEGKVILVLPPQQVDRALTVMRDHSLGRRAGCIGRLVQSELPLVEMILTGGGRRIVQRPYGEELPRIC